jgi:uncharacterized protein
MHDDDVGLATVDDDALIAVCRTTHRLILAQGGTFADAQDAVRAELRRAGFDVTADSDAMTSGMRTIMVMLADGRYIQRDAQDRWSVQRNPATG